MQRLFCLFSLLLLGLAYPVAATNRYTSVIARLAPGISRAELERELLPGMSIGGWMPQINAAVLSVPAGTAPQSLGGAAVDAIQPNGSLQPVAEGPDPRLAEQYGLAKIKAPAAWKRATGLGTVVAIIDTGAQVDHPDLVSQLWTNSGEIVGNGVDDDKNGYVDDLHGWHWYHDEEGQPRSDSDVRDGHGHGTHVAGIVGAARNNAQGIAGVAPDTRLMILRIFGRPDVPNDADGKESDIALAVLYAADNGADVINMSLGGDLDVPALREAVRYAINRGIVVIAAAGNTGGKVLYPARYPEVIAIASIDSNDKRVASSGYGPEISLSAPGAGILSTSRPAGGSCASFQQYYWTCSGTSMAAPFVSGTAALIYEIYAGYDPVHIRTILELTADDIGATGYDEMTGWGRINAERAVEYAYTNARNFTRIYMPFVAN